MKKYDIAMISLLITLAIITGILLLPYIKMYDLKSRMSNLQLLYEKEKTKLTAPAFDPEQDMAVMAAIGKVYEQEFMDITERVFQKTIGMEPHVISQVKWTECVDGSEDELYNAFYQIIERLDMRLYPNPGHIYYVYDDYQYGECGILCVAKSELPFVDPGGFVEINPRMSAYYSFVLIDEWPPVNKFR